MDNNSLKKKSNHELYLKIQLVSRGRHTPPQLQKKNQSVLYVETNADCFEIHKNHCYSLCRPNGKSLIVW